MAWSMRGPPGKLALVEGSQRVAGNVALEVGRGHIKKHIDFQV